MDIAAPGGAGGGLPNDQQILGLKQPYNGNSYDSSNYNFYAGTSMAAPHVSGALALIKSRFPWENYAGIRDRVLMGTDRTGTLEGICRTNARLNAYKALQTRSMLRNLSARARVEGGDRVLIGGFAIGGSATGGPLKVAIRGLGPSLSSQGITVARLGNPRIELYNSAGVLMASNNDWQQDVNAGDLQANGLQPPDRMEAAMVRSLNPGAYTVILRDQGTQYGVGLFEIYELEGNTNEKSRLRNLSARCLVRTGQEEAVAGSIIGNTAATGLPKPKRRVLIFGKGPSLTGLAGRLMDPQIQILNAGGASNDNWRTIGGPLEEELTEAGVAPTDNGESALWPTFQPGSYTIALRGTAGSTGIGLIEFYEY